MGKGTRRKRRPAKTHAEAVRDWVTRGSVPVSLSLFASDNASKTHKKTADFRRLICLAGTDRHRMLCLFRLCPDRTIMQDAFADHRARVQGVADVPGM